MIKKFAFVFGLILALVLSTGVVAAAPPAPPTPEITFTLVSGPLPSTMNVGDVFTVIVQVDSDIPFSGVQANPSFQFPGKGMVAVQGGDHAGSGTSATVEITYKAKSDTSRMPGGFAPVFFVVGVRYVGGFVAVQEYQFNVTVP